MTQASARPISVVLKAPAEAGPHCYYTPAPVTGRMQAPDERPIFLGQKLPVTEESFDNQRTFFFFPSDPPKRRRAPLSSSPRRRVIKQMHFFKSAFSAWKVNIDEERGREEKPKEREENAPASTV